MLWGGMTSRQTKAALLNNWPHSPSRSSPAGVCSLFRTSYVSIELLSTCIGGVNRCTVVEVLLFWRSSQASGSRDAQRLFDLFITFWMCFHWRLTVTGPQDVCIMVARARVISSQRYARSSVPLFTHSKIKRCCLCQFRNTSMSAAMTDLDVR